MIGLAQHADVLVIGAGAAGLFAAIHAGREGQSSARGQPLKVVALDGASKLGAKILVAGGGRCNVTHHAVDETAYAGSSRHAIKKVLRSFGVEQTKVFFEDLGVTLKREETGKLFPTTDDAHTVLNALLKAAGEAGAQLVHPWRVDRVWKEGAIFSAQREGGETFSARRLILATGGMALPKSGSDGVGYGFARTLGHSITPRVFPALVPLTLAEGHFLRDQSGVTVPAELTVTLGTGKRVVSFQGSTLFTHFGLSGPGPLDVSRYYLDAKQDDPKAQLLINFLPGHTTESFDTLLTQWRDASPMRMLTGGAGPGCRLPQRLARALCDSAGVDPAGPTHNLPREDRRRLAIAATAHPLPVTGSRGFTPAETTAGGIPLSELHLDTMESRICPGLHVCGEVCDVDGRIGGFNFQWAWASGYLAGRGAARSG